MQWKLSSDPASAWSYIWPDGSVPHSRTGYVFSGTQYDEDHNTSTVRNGTAYDLRVRAVSKQPGRNVFSRGPWVTLTDKVPQLLAAPTNLVVTQGYGKLDLAWTAPRVTLTGYEVHYTSAPGTGTGAVADDAAVQTGAASAGWVAVTRSGTTAMQAIPGLDNGTDYRVRVRVINGAQRGSWAHGKGTPQLLPAPTNLAVTEGDFRLDLKWTAPSGTLTGYDVHYTSAPSAGTGAVADDAAVQSGAASAGWKAVNRSGTTATQAIIYLDNGANYRVRVRVINGAQLGFWVHGTGTPQWSVPVNTCAKPTAAGLSVGVLRGTPAISAKSTNPNEDAYAFPIFQIKGADDAWPTRKVTEDYPSGIFLHSDFEGSNPCRFGAVVAGLTPGASYDVRFHLLDLRQRPVPVSTAPIRVTVWNVPGKPTGCRRSGGGSASLT